MTTLLTFSLILFAAVLVSDLAERSVVSTAVLVLAGGFLTGPHLLGLSHFTVSSPITALIAALALFATLFTDGQRVSVGSIAADWRAPLRALLIGMPLSICGVAVLGRWLAGLSWHDGFLLGAALAPTDPVFASSIVQREQISDRLRHLLNVESGLNDGLALPIVLGLLHRYSATEIGHRLIWPVLEGVAVGAAVMAVADRLEGSRLFRAHASYRGMAGFSLAATVYALARLLQANEFLAAFAAGMTAISLRPELSAEFSAFVGQGATMLKFAGVFILGGLIAPGEVVTLRGGELLFIALTLVAVRPLSLVPALWGERLPRREWIAAAWFGPKGFASVLYAVFIIQAQAPGAAHLFLLAAMVIAASIVAHSTSEVPLARWLTAARPDDRPAPVAPQSPW
jgi:NhaP-type Na+/H+ or K+/H+ antiporter